MYYRAASIEMLTSLWELFCQTGSGGDSCQIARVAQHKNRTRSLEAGWTVQDRQFWKDGPSVRARSAITGFHREQKEDGDILDNFVCKQNRAWVQMSGNSADRSIQMRSLRRLLYDMKVTLYIGPSLNLPKK